MSPALSWLLLMGGLAAIAFGVDKLVNAKDSLQRTVTDPSRFDVFGDDEGSGAVQGAASEPRLTEREWPRSDAFLAEARAKAAEAEEARELIERWAQ